MLAVDVWDGGQTAASAAGEALALAEMLGFERLGAKSSRLMVRGGEPAWVKRAPAARAAGFPRVFFAAGFEWG